MMQDIYTVKELASKWKTGINTVSNLIRDGRLRPMRMPTMVIPLKEVIRFEDEAVKTQEDFSKYADKKFTEKYLEPKKKASIVEFDVKDFEMMATEGLKGKG